MSTSARLREEIVRVEPGGHVVVPIQVRNTSDIVEAYRLEVLGVPQGWANVEPESLTLYPGTEGEAQIMLHPLRDSGVLPGQMPFGVRVLPTERPQDVTVVEALLDVAPFSMASAELTPAHSHATRSAVHDIAVDNRGNARQTVEFDAVDTTDQLDFVLKPPFIAVAAGEAAFAKLKVKARKRMLRGTPINRPFQVVVRPEGGEEIWLDGMMLQKPVFSAAAFRALKLAPLALLALALLWFLLLRPTIKSAAEDAVAEPVAESQENAAAAEEQAAAAEQAAEGAAAAEETAETSAGAAQEVVEELDPRAIEAVTGVPSANRLFATAPAGGATVDTLAIEDGTRLAVTDLVMQNPQGDTGTLTIRRGAQVLISSSLANFRDLDYHFVTPIIADAGGPLIMELQCVTPGAGGTCAAAVLVGGAVQTIPAEG